MSLELVTFRYCPFGQRCLIALNEKGPTYGTTYIEDLDSPPDWFVHMSPLKKVPVLRVEGKVIFDSTVINDYLDESLSPELHPHKAINRALHRSWISFAGELLAAQMAVFTTKTEGAFHKKLEPLQDLIDKLAAAPIQEPFFGGNRFSLVDAAFAPFFIRQQLMAPLRQELAIGHPVLTAWSQALVQRASVIRSTPSGFEEGYRTFLAGKGSWLVNTA